MTTVEDLLAEMKEELPGPLRLLLALSGLGLYCRILDARRRDLLELLGARAGQLASEKC